MTIAIKIGVAIAMLAILASLFSGAFFLVRDDSGSRRVVRALSWRIGLSVGLFALILILVLTGVIEPNSHPVRQ